VHLSVGAWGRTPTQTWHQPDFLEFGNRVAISDDVIVIAGDSDSSSSSGNSVFVYELTEQVHPCTPIHPYTYTYTHTHIHPYAHTRNLKPLLSKICMCCWMVSSIYHRPIHSHTPTHPIHIQTYTYPVRIHIQVHTYTHTHIPEI